MTTILINGKEPPKRNSIKLLAFVDVEGERIIHQIPDGVVL